MQLLSHGAEICTQAFRRIWALNLHLRLPPQWKRDMWKRATFRKINIAVNKEQKRNRKANVKEGCQPKQSAGGILSPDERKTAEQDENDCKNMLTFGIPKRWGKEWTRVSGYARGTIRKPWKWKKSSTWNKNWMDGGSSGPNIVE